MSHFNEWEFVEIGWGDEGFYRGGDSISLSESLDEEEVDDDEDEDEEDEEDDEEEDNSAFLS